MSSSAQPKVFDKDAAMDRVSDDGDFLVELFELAFEDSKLRLNQIEDAISNQNYQQLAESSHALKSAMGNIGAMQCHASCAYLEQLGKSKEIKGAKEELSSLLDKIELFKTEAEKFKSSL